MSTDQNQVIGISREEATSSHVDDLLKRQMSLRGEPGVTRDRGKKWYYQNWFVLMVVGALGAFIAGAIIEPFFDDHLYLQGAIAAVDGAEDQRLFAKVKIRGETIYVFSTTKEIEKDGSKRRADLDSLRVGDTLGLYVSYLEVKTGEEQLPVASFLVRSPAPQSEDAGKATLEQLQSQHRVSALLLFPLV